MTIIRVVFLETLSLLLLLLQTSDAQLRTSQRLLQDAQGPNRRDTDPNVCVQYDFNRNFATGATVTAGSDAAVYWGRALTVTGDAIVQSFTGSAIPGFNPSDLAITTTGAATISLTFGCPVEVQHIHWVGTQDWAEPPTVTFYQDANRRRFLQAGCGGEDPPPPPPTSSDSVSFVGIPNFWRNDNGEAVGRHYFNYKFPNSEWPDASWCVPGEPDKCGDDITSVDVSFPQGGGGISRLRVCTFDVACGNNGWGQA